MANRSPEGRTGGAEEYRPDIDGLRALAVVPVALFHARIPGFAGGYVGVDVFFVISGFLITSILLRDIRAGDFSLARFYERRIRRLLPALFAVVTASMAIAYWLLLPREFQNFGKSVAASALWVSNVLFFREAGYFDAPAELKPLLHTWSLAVEEQFYLLFPLMLVALYRFFSGYAVSALLALSVLSFALCAWMMSYRESAAFYLLPFRAWELGMGALLAAAALPAPRERAATILGAVGLACILAAVFFYTPATPFPGWAAALPCLGAALLIYSGASRGSAIRRLLSLRPVVFVGLISYSFYLWHWPALVFARYYHIDDLGVLGEASVVLAALAGSALCWRFVERPFRHSDRFSRRAMFAFLGLAILLWGAFGAAAHLTRGMPGRLPPEALPFARALHDFNPQPEPCVRWQADRPDSPFCLIGATKQQAPTFLVWGDSHAGVLSYGVSAAAETAGTTGLLAGLGGCPPLLGIDKDETAADTALDEACVPHNRRVLALLEQHRSIQTVILIARWAYYAKGGGVGVDRHNRITLRLLDPAATPQAGNAEIVRVALPDTLRTLGRLGREVYVLGQVPEMEDFSLSRVARLLARNAGGTLPADLDMIGVTPRQSVEHRQSDFSAMAGALAGLPSVRVLETRHLFCDERLCRGVREGIPRYFDNNHVTITTARGMRGLFAAAVAADRPERTALRP